MKILSMTATFGKLDNETISLRGGLNVLSAPNEWGKSTWCAFLCAMLYGIDTRERSRSDQLADKEKYQPWSGKPMEGTMRLLHEGRDITIRRRTKGRVPMGDFQAYETKTGLTVRELTGENCGQVLLGVEKSVFLRTGFLRFSDLPVKQDESLRRRLNALVTTGDESGSAELLDGRLRELKNRCRHNQTGLIPECSARIRELEDRLAERQRLQRTHDRLEQQSREREDYLKQLELHRQTLDWQDAQADQQRVRDAGLAVKTADRLARELEEKYKERPDRARLEQQIGQAREDLEELELSLIQEPPPLWPAVAGAVAAAVLLIAALLWADRQLLIPCIVLCLVVAGVSAHYADRWHREMLWIRVDRVRRSNRRDELQRYLEKWQRELQDMQDLDQARQNALRAREQLGVLESMARTAPCPEEPDPLRLSREETMEQIGRVGRDLSHARMQLAQCRGRMENLPDGQTLQLRLDRERSRLRELERTLEAVTLARQALDTAARELQRRFAPQISRRAGELLRFLTDGAYDRISIDDDLTVQAARDDETTMRTALWRSEGTGDQMYLALRLAVWEVLSPDSPLVLDDALIRFDQKRMEKALELLKELSKERQILLFSCQERERQYLMKQL